MLGQSLYMGERLEKNLNAICYCGMVISVVGIITTTLNIIQQRGLATWATVCIMLAGFIIMYCAGVKRNRDICASVVAFICLTFFTVFAIYGINDGFAIIWTLLVPISYSYFISARWGTVIGLYYQLLFIVLFYTPLRNDMSAYYSKTFMDRFPILYFCAFIISSVAMIQYHLSTLRQIEYETNLEKEVFKQTKAVREKAEKISRMSYETVEALAGAIDAKDAYTKGHSARVAEYSAIIAEGFGLPEHEIKELRREALLHDIGKIGISDNVLNKPGRLDDDEYTHIKNHTIIGAEILKDIQMMPGASSVARHHHERYDGKGYPDGLKGEEIPLHARIVAVADAYDSMKTDRVYRKSLSESDIRREIEEGKDKQFDPILADILLKAVFTARGS